MRNILLCVLAFDKAIPATYEYACHAKQLSIKPRAAAG